MRVLVMGATGGSGRAAVKQLLEAGHEVTAFARRPEEVFRPGERLRLLAGDATRPADVERAVAGQDAVIVTLGIREDALRVRLRGSRGTPLDVRSAGTGNVIAAMRGAGVRRLVVQTSYGVGETRGRLPLDWKLIFALLLKPQIADTERQEALVRQSGLDWVLVQPVSLTDVATDEPPHTSAAGEVRSMKVARASVGRFLAEAVAGGEWIGRSVALSGTA